jgi:DNA repair exonuclease SbcCD nuclease subunit
MSSSKIIVLSDTHFHPFTEFATFDEHGRNERLVGDVGILDTITAYALEHKIKHVVHGGDLLHKPGMVPTEAYALVAAALRRMRDAGITFIGNDGNHDHADRAGTVHSLQALASGGLAEIVGDCTLEGSPSPDEGCRILYTRKTYQQPVVLFSYCEDPKVLLKRVRNVKKAMGDGTTEALAIFHHGFKGARVGTLLEKVIREPVEGGELEGIFARILSGHFHTAQPILGLTNGSYIGSPQEHTRSDIELLSQPKGFIVYDFQNNSFERVPVNRPRFTKVTSAHAPTLEVKGNYVDMTYHQGEDSERLRKELLEAGAAGVRTLRLPTKESIEQDGERMRIRASASPQRALSKHVKRAAPKAERKELLTAGMELLQEANHDA